MANDIISIDEQRGNFCAVIADKGIEFDRERTFFRFKRSKPTITFVKVATNNPEFAAGGGGQWRPSASALTQQASWPIWCRAMARSADIRIWG